MTFVLGGIPCTFHNVLSPAAAVVHQEESRRGKVMMPFGQVAATTCPGVVTTTVWVHGGAVEAGAAVVDEVVGMGVVVVGFAVLVTVVLLVGSIVVWLRRPYWSKGTL